MKVIGWQNRIFRTFRNNSDVETKISDTDAKMILWPERISKLLVAGATWKTALVNFMAESDLLTVGCLLKKTYEKKIE